MKEELLKELKAILKKYNAEILLKEQGRPWMETSYISVEIETEDYNYEEIDCGTAIIPE